MLILKHVRYLCDESLVEQFSENLYCQNFSGEHQFQPYLPCVPSELVVFRNSNGEVGTERIVKE
jgi:IS5 family transposase